MDKQLFAEKSFIYLKNGIKILAMIPCVPNDIKNIEIPLEIIYKRMQWDGWFKNNLSMNQIADLRKAIEQAFKEAQEKLPTNKRDLLNRARPEIENLIIENSSILASFESDEKIINILDRAVYLEGEYLTEDDFNNLAINFLNILAQKIDNSSFADKLNREKIENIWIYIETIGKRVDKLEHRVTKLEFNDICGSAIKPHNDRIKTANDLYAQAFEEIMFLHKNKAQKVRLCDIFVEHKYKLIDYMFEYDPAGIETTVSILDYIKEFFVDHEKNPSFLFIEGDAGLGKSGFISYLAHLYSKGDELFGDRKLICIRLRDIIPPNMRFSHDSINSDILRYLNVDSVDLFKEWCTGSIVLLDGFDELCMVEKINENVDRCLYDLQGLFGDCKVIITSRPQYLKIRGLDIRRFHIVLKHFDKAQREEWVAKYGCVSSSLDEVCALEYIKNIDDEDTIGICDTPMALYMLASGRINEDAKRNHWVLYNQIFNKELTETEYNSVFPSKTGVHRHAISQYSDLLYQIGAEIAYKMYINNNTKLYLNDDEIQEVVNGLKIQNASIKEVVKCCYALCSYWKTNENKGAVEFYHNNIRDFFMCEKIFYAMDKLYEECEIISNEQIPQTIIQRLHTLFHYSEINAKVIEFLYLRILYQNEKTAKDNFAKKEYKKKYFSMFFYFIISGDIGIEHEQTLGDAYMSIINVLSNTIQIYRHVYEPYLSEHNELIDWFGYGSTNSNHYAHSGLKQIFKKIFIKTPLTIEDKIIYTMGKAVFDYADFDGADLRFAGFSGSSIRNAVFSNTALLSADFEGSNLSHTIFINADLHLASFRNCILTECDFSDANLADTILPDGFSSSDSAKAAEHLRELKIEGLKV